MNQASPQATIWNVPVELENDLRELVSLEAQAKATDTKRQQLKEKLLAWADDNFCKVVRSDGALPPTPWRLSASTGECLTLVIAAGSKEIKEEHSIEISEINKGLLQQTCEISIEIPEGNAELMTKLVEIVSDALATAAPLKRKLTADQRRDLCKPMIHLRLSKDALTTLVAEHEKRHFPKLYELLQPGLTRYLKAS